MKQLPRTSSTFGLLARHVVGLGSIFLLVNCQSKSSPSEERAMAAPAATEGAKGGAPEPELEPGARQEEAVMYDRPSAAAAPAPVGPADQMDGFGYGAGGGGALGRSRSASRGGGQGAPEMAVAPLSANARYATTYRPGRGYVSAFDSAVAQGQLPASYRQLLGDVGGQYVGPLAAPTDKALNVGFESERSALGQGVEEIGLRVALRGNEVAPARAPLAVTLVLDTSGSMAGKAIDNAKKAAKSVVGKLQDGDHFTMVTFASDAEMLVSRGQVGPRRAEILSKIDGVVAQGGTNISAGLDLAYRWAKEQGASSDAVQVALLLSDGEATAGDTNAASIANRSFNAFQAGVQTSAFGVGENFDAQLMSTIADRGAGGYYYLSDSTKIAAALSTEIDARLRPVATAVEVRVRLADGVVPTRVFGSRQLSVSESSAVRAQEVAIDKQEATKHDIVADRQEDSERGMRFFMPAFAAADKHATLLKVRVPQSAGKTETPIAVLEVRYKDRKSNKNEMAEISLVLKRNGQIVANKSVQAAMVAYSAGEDLLRAADMAQANQKDLAVKLLDESAASLLAAAKQLDESNLGADSQRMKKLAAVVGAGKEKPMALAVLLRGSGYGYLQ